MTYTVEYSWLDLVIRSNPNHVRDSQYVTEYEFSAPGGTGDERTHEGHRRVFKGYYQRRGAYAPETVSSGGLTWRGIPLDWNGQPMTWGED